MKHSAIALISLALAASTMAYEVVLRRGMAHTPAQAKAELEDFRKTYSDLAGWDEL